MLQDDLVVIPHFQAFVNGTIGLVAPRRHPQVILVAGDSVFGKVVFRGTVVIGSAVDDGADGDLRGDLSERKELETAFRMHGDAVFLRVGPPGAHVVPVVMGKHEIINLPVGGGRHEMVHVMDDHASGADVRARAGNAARRVQGTHFLRHGTGGVQQHRGAVREDEPKAFASAGIDGVDVQPSFLPHGEFAAGAETVRAFVAAAKQGCTQQGKGNQSIFHVLDY